jgi:hypothetical protein
MKLIYQNSDISAEYDMSSFSAMTGAKGYVFKKKTKIEDELDIFEARRFSKNR